LKSSLLCLVVVCLAAPAFASPQKDVIAKFYELRTRVLDQHGTEADIDGVLALFADTGKYEHPQFKASMTKAMMRRGMLSHMREGKEVTFKVHRIQEAKTFAIAEVDFSFIVDGKKISRTGVAIFEFQGHKLMRVAEYGL
jgi:hypothetical protein